MDAILVSEVPIVQMPVTNTHMAKGVIRIVVRPVWTSYATTLMETVQKVVCLDTKEFTVSQLAVTTNMATVVETNAVIFVWLKSVTTSQENVTNIVCLDMTEKDVIGNANIHIMAVAACTYVANIVSTGCVTPYTEFALRAACQATDDHFVHLSVLLMHMVQSVRMSAATTVTIRHVTM